MPAPAGADPDRGHHLPLEGHSKSDQNLYRTREEIESWRQRDPIDRFEQAVLEAGTLDEAELEQVRTRPATPCGTPSGSADRPPPSRDLLAAVYAPSEVDAHRHRRGAAGHAVGGRGARAGAGRGRGGPGGGRGVTATETQVETMTFAEAIRAALTEAMEADERVFVLGEDIGVYGGAFGVTTGMLDRFGPSGSATPRSPRRPSWGRPSGPPCAACGRWPRCSSPTSPPMPWTSWSTRRPRSTSCSAGRSACPGRPAAVRLRHRRRRPALPEPGGLVRHARAQGGDAVQPGRRQGAAARGHPDPNPVVFMEHKLLYRTASGRCPRAATPSPWGGRRAREGRDLTIVATGIMVSRALAAAEELAAGGIEATVVDPAHPHAAGRGDHPGAGAGHRPGPARSRRRPARPGSWPRSRPASPSRTPSTTCWPRSGGSGGLDAPIPYNPDLEKASVPQVPDIVQAARTLVEDG